MRMKLARSMFSSLFLWYFSLHFVYIFAFAMQAIAENFYFAEKKKCWRSFLIFERNKVDRNRKVSECGHNTNWCGNVRRLMNNFDDLRRTKRNRFQYFILEMLFSRFWFTLISIITTMYFLRAVFAFCRPHPQRSIEKIRISFRKMKPFFGFN